MTITSPPEGGRRPPPTQGPSLLRRVAIATAVLTVLLALGGGLVLLRGA